VTTETVERCEAQDRITRALHEMDVQWGSRKLDYSKVRSILSGDDHHD
jgi:hypothetical protein